MFFCRNSAFNLCSSQLLADVCVHYKQHGTNPMRVQCWSTIAGQQPYNTGQCFMLVTICVHRAHAQPIQCQLNFGPASPARFDAGTNLTQHCITTHVHQEEDICGLRLQCLQRHKSKGHSIQRLD